MSRLAGFHHSLASPSSTCRPTCVTHLMVSNHKLLPCQKTTNRYISMKETNTSSCPASPLGRANSLTRGRKSLTTAHNIDHEYDDIDGAESIYRLQSPNSQHRKYEYCLPSDRPQPGDVLRAMVGNAAIRCRSVVLKREKTGSSWARTKKLSPALGEKNCRENKENSCHLGKGRIKGCVILPK